MELDKTSEARRKAQRNGEEDPVVVAQRFLNIYRQLHIFNPEKKAAFNKMLLELPPQIRGLFGQLPGGAMLQDYVDELAEKQGIAKSTTMQSADIADDDVKQAKILATALAEAQVQATAKMQEMGATPVAAPLGVAPTATATTAKLAMDKTFAQEFATVLAAAMQKNSVNQENEIKNIINTLGQTQLQIIKVLQTENTEHREEMKKISQMMLQSQSQINSAQPQSSGGIGEETKQLIKVLINGQKQIIERVAKVEAAAQQQPAANTGADLTALMNKSEQNFSHMISALNDRQKNDTLEIARLINESQQNLVQMMVQHNTLNQNSGNSSAANNNANNIQINTTDYSAVLEKIADKLNNLQMPAAAPKAANTNIQVNFPEHALSKLIKAQSEIYQEIAARQTKELSAIISVALKESQKASTQNIIEALKLQPAIHTESAPIPRHIPQFVESEIKVPEYTPAEPEPSTDPIDLFDEPETNTAEQPSSGFDFGDAEPANQPDEELNLENIFAEAPEETPAEADIPTKKKRKRKKKKKNPDIIAGAVEETPTVNDEPQVENTSLEDMLSAPQEPETGPVEEIIETAAPQEEAVPATESLDDIITEEPDSLPAAADNNDQVSSEPETEPEAEIETEAETKTEAEAAPVNIWADNDNDTENDAGISQLEDFIEQSSDTADDWGFSTAPEPTKEPEQDWEWVYEEEPATDVEKAASDDGEGTDWEWEYVPDNEAENTVSFSNSNLQPLSDKNPICSGDLFFQQQIFNPQPLVSGTAMLPVGHLPQIIDSAILDQDKDPYQNSARKD